MKKNLLPALIGLLLSFSITAQVVTVSTLTTGLVRPVCVTNSGLPNDNRLFVIEKVGRIRIIDRTSGVMNPVSFLDISSRIYSSGNEQGLLGLTFHPNYAVNGYFYVNYINLSQNTVIARYQVSSFADTAMVNSEAIMMTVAQPYSNHNGGNLMFGWDGYLYISLGDGGSGGDPGNRAQNINTLLGKMLRVDVSNPNSPYYYSPPTNPFYNGNSPTGIPYTGTLPGSNEIFDWGLRNAWRASIDRMTGDKWYGDVGQNVMEEIDFESRCDSAGKNFGWRCYEGTQPYNTSGCQPASSYTAPVSEYSHSLGCSVSGGYVYRGGQEGAMFGKYFFADYCSGRIWETHPNGTGGWITTLVTQTNALNSNRYSSFGEDVYGELYLTGDGNSGLLYKIVDTACAPTAYINAPDTIINCSGGPITFTFNAIYGTGLSYQWYEFATGPIPGGTSSTFITNISPGEHSYYVVVMNSNCSATSNSIQFYSNASFTGLGTFYCDTATPVSLTGVPFGGTFSGPGINGNMFSPALAGIGTHQVIYTYADTVSNCYYTASGCILSDTQTVVVDICTGIEEQNDVRNLSVYPNPNHSEFNIEVSLARDNDVSLIITDALGRMVKEQNIKAARGKQNIQVTLDVTDGIYFLYMKTKSSMAVSKVIVQR